MSKSLTYLVFFGRFSINGGENIFLSFSFLIVNSLSPGKRQIFSFDSSQSIEHHFDFPLLIAQFILWYLYRAGNWERFGLHRPTTLFVCDRPLPIYPLCLSQDVQLGWVGRVGGRGGGRGRVYSLLWPILARKGYLFFRFRSEQGRDFTSWSALKGSENHFCLERDLTGKQDVSEVVEKKNSWFTSRLRAWISGRNLPLL